ncbi:uncharacterized protein B0I36DRAFT_368202 [Microdochium trichocladiopsis]|uniref:Uncharacterized protein n=1 Tax=Microdochium trichocladiopsis TaxID=1682393 RepID=A0A9P8XU41_9PEZI|nr:uncharacterized protein B0I36DRAFT_368202 [Microdochium trichocladiopsis]KAH7018159.1 hypothetical protein B0I36DRAFT_368202 [Microdochium trichocladiopsis]
MKLDILKFLALCLATTASADAIEERQLNLPLTSALNPVTSLVGSILSPVVSSSSIRLSSSSIRVSASVSAGVSASVPTISASVSVGVSASVSASIPTITPSVSAGVSVSVSVSVPTNIVSGTIGLSANPLFSSQVGASATIALCVPAASPLLNVPALSTGLGSVTTAINKAANPVVASNPLLGPLSPLVSTTLTSTQLLADLGSINTLLNVNVLGILAAVSAGGGCLSVGVQLDICQLVFQLIDAEERLLTTVQNACINRIGVLCSPLSLDVNLVLQQLVAVQITIDQVIQTLISLDVLPECRQKMLDRQSDLKGTIAGTVYTLANLPNVVTTNVGNQVVQALGITGGFNGPVFQSLAGYPNRKRGIILMRRVNRLPADEEDGDDDWDDDTEDDDGDEDEI